MRLYGNQYAINIREKLAVIKPVKMLKPAAVATSFVRLRAANEPMVRTELLGRRHAVDIVLGEVLGERVELGAGVPVGLAAGQLRARVAELDGMHLRTREHIDVVRHARFGDDGLTLPKDAELVRTVLHLDEGDLPLLHGVELAHISVVMGVLPSPFGTGNRKDVAAAVGTHQTEPELAIPHLLVLGADAHLGRFFDTDLSLLHCCLLVPRLVGPKLQSKFDYNFHPTIFKEQLTIAQYCHFVNVKQNRLRFPESGLKKCIFVLDV